MSRKTLIILALVLGPVGLMVLFAATGWFGQAFPNAHFVIAFALGGTATVLLSVGLFALSFYSARSGHDEQIGNENEQDSDEA
jgi:hypothetical protein